MDRALQKEREAFKKRALANPVIENKVTKPQDSSTSSKSNSTSSIKPKAIDISNYKQLSLNSASQYKFGVLARIVRHMRSRHREGEIHALTLSEILDETNQLNVLPKTKQWLLTDALPNNPKLSEVEGGKWVFNPALPVRDKKGLLKLLRNNDVKGGGGLLVEDIQESVPHSDDVVKALNKDLIYITRPSDKKQIVFYHDQSLNFVVDAEFQQLWRNTSVDGLHDDNIEEYLNKQGIKSMQGVARVFRPPVRRKTKARRLQPTKITDNDHLAHLLQEYDQP